MIGSPRDFVGTTLGRSRLFLPTIQATTLPTSSTIGKTPYDATDHHDDGDINGSLAYHPVYTRLIPAVTTIVLFLVGLFTIYIIHCIKQKAIRKRCVSIHVPYKYIMNN